MNLKTYLSLDGNSEKELAASLGVSQATVNRYANMKRWPDREMILLIAEKTGGAVGPADWFEQQAAAE